MGDIRRFVLWVSAVAFVTVFALVVTLFMIEPVCGSMGADSRGTCKTVGHEWRVAPVVERIK